MSAATSRPNSARFNVLDLIERGGNALPHPITMFAGLAGIVLVISWITEMLGVSAIHPRDGSVLAAQNLLDREGIARIFTEAVDNFTVLHRSEPCSSRCWVSASPKRAA